ncbi:hypothetical protein ACFWU5_23720 [Nocardia sp. NPDC058640]|uniref:hypothetical protein n=1 Tax=Nocardia sp. NPDC058640 TaxID=3346571 RepID=UPI00365393F0
MTVSIHSRRGFSVVAREHIPARIAALTVEQRRALVPALTEARSALPPGSWTLSKRHAAVQLWGLGFLATPAAVCRWLTVGATRHLATEPHLLIACLEAGDRDHAWRGELAERLAAARVEQSGDLPYFPLIVHLLRSSGSPAPTTDSFVTTWARKLHGDLPLPPPWDVHQLSAGSNLLAQLRGDPFLPQLVHRLVEIDKIGLHSTGNPDNSWPHVLATLADAGVIDREELHTNTLNALVRGTGRATDTAERLGVLTALKARPDECVPRIRGYSRLLAEGTSTAAWHAQGVLTTLHREGMLSSVDVVGLSDEVLRRPEKKLLRAQLSWLDRIVRADPQSAPSVAQVLVEAAETIDDAALRERIERIVARCTPTPDDTARTAPALEAPFTLPKLPPPAPMTGLPSSIADTADLFTRLTESQWSYDHGLAELLFDGVVRFTAQDRDALTATMTPLLQPALFAVGAWRIFGLRHRWGRRHGWTPLTLTAVATGALVQLPGRLDETDPLALRMAEWGARVIDNAPLPPFALATPTCDNGQIDARELVARLRAYQAAGVDPGPIEFAQAMVRVAPTADADIRAAVRSLDSEQGRRLESWLEGDHLALPMPFAALAAGPAAEACRIPLGRSNFPVPEVLARWPFPEQDVLVLAEMPGTKGPAVHRSVALALTEGATRAAGVDALVALAATDQLDTALIAAAIPEHAVSKRFAATLRDATAALGAHRTWPLFVELLPRFVATPSAVGLADVLAAAGDCAQRCGARAEIPGLVALAERKSATRLRAEARALHAVLRTRDVLAQSRNAPGAG